jgi:hypothetical protein
MLLFCNREEAMWMPQFGVAKSGELIVWFLFPLSFVRQSTVVSGFSSRRRLELHSKDYRLFRKNRIAHR